jgi:Tfp pilus assembly protein PilX
MKMKILPIRKQRGSTLLTTLFICSLLGLSTMGYLSLVEFQNRMSFRSQSWNLTMSLVEAGIEEGLAHLNLNYDKLDVELWARNGDLYTRHRDLPTGSYDVTINGSNIQYPTVQATATVNLSTLAQSRRSSFFAVIGPNGESGAVSRSVLVHTYRGKLFTKAMVAKNTIDMKGNNVKTDSFDSTDPAYSDGNGGYDPTKFKAEGDVASNTNITGAINVGNANIYGHVSTGPGGTVKIGANGAVGDADWQASNTGIQPGWVSDTSNFTFPDTLPPYSSGANPYSPRDIITVVSSSTNMTAISNSMVYPDPAPITGVVTNTIMVSTNSVPSPEPAGLVTNYTPATVLAYPSGLPSGTAVTTNTTSASSTAYPASGTYVGGVTTNTTTQTSSTYPTSGIIIGSVTTNTVVTTDNKAPAAGTYVGTVSVYEDPNPPKKTTYTFNKITGYTYNRFSNYSYNRIASYTYDVVTYQYPTYAYSYALVNTSTVYATNHYDNVLYSGDYLASSLSGDTIVLGTARIILDTFSMNTGDSIKIANGGSLEMYVGGTSVSLSGNDIVNEPGLAQNFIVYCAPSVTSVSLSGNASFTGVLVAPNASVSLNGSGNSTAVDFIGSLLADSITLNGHFNFHYDEALKKLPPNGRYLITQWDEVVN